MYPRKIDANCPGSKITKVILRYVTADKYTRRYGYRNIKEQNYI